MREEEKKYTSPSSKVQRFFRKRWVFPAIYLASAALILTAVLWYQNSKDDVAESNKQSQTAKSPKTAQDEPAVPANQAVEKIAMPVLNPEAVKIQKQFYEFDASKEEQEAALVFYNNTYQPNKGVDINMEDGKSFDVVASLSGTVIKAAEDSLLGNVVEIEHDKGVVTVYQSLTDLQVQEGDQVKQGQALGKAGKNQLNVEAGNHVHFEIRKDDVAVNPVKFFEQPFTSLTEAEMNESEKANTEEQAPATEGQAPAEGKTPPADEKKSGETGTQEQGTTEEKQPADKKAGENGSEQGTTEESTEGSAPAEDKKADDTEGSSEEGQSSDETGTISDSPDASAGLARG